MLLTKKNSDQTSTQNNIGERLSCYFVTVIFCMSACSFFPLQCHKMSRKICRCTWYYWRDIGALFISVCLSVHLSVCVASYAQLITQFEIWPVFSFSLRPFISPSVFINNHTGQIIFKKMCPLKYSYTVWSLDFGFFQYKYD